MILADEFYDQLAEAGFSFFCGVPDSLLKDMCACFSARAEKGRHVIAANEGSAVGMACGWHVATGQAAVVYMQNSGEGNAVNPLLSIADPDVYSIPMLLVIGWRGQPGVHDEPQHVKQGKVTCGLLEAMGIPFEVLDEMRWQEQVAGLAAKMQSECRPVALVVRKGAFEPYGFTPEASSYPLTRESMIELVLDRLGERDFIVSTTGKTSRELFEARQRRGQAHGNDFLTVGGMGHTASIAYGMAAGSENLVWCLDGDGSLIMHMGSLAVIGQSNVPNFRYIVNVNGAHESVGGQPTVGFGIDVCGVLRSCGFSEVFEASDGGEIASAVDAMRTLPGSALVVYTRQGSRSDLGRPTTTPQENKLAMMGCFEALR